MEEYIDTPTLCPLSLIMVRFLRALCCADGTVSETKQRKENIKEIRASLCWVTASQVCDFHIFYSKHWINGSGSEESDGSGSQRFGVCMGMVFFVRWIRKNRRNCIF